MSCYRQSAMAMVVLCGMVAHAQDVLKITKVDPPNWWASMPEPMLLVRGEGFRDAAFSLSDKNLQVQKTVVSENGHWAQVWLSASPAHPETVTLRVARGPEYVESPYTFADRRSASDGFSGFSSRDVMYLIMTDRFADGDRKNDGPHASSSEGSADALAERAKPRGWHGGDLKGVEEHLDYLQQLGVTTVWITPVYQNHEDDSYHGYGATDLYRVDEHYGSLTDLQSLANALHKRGMKLVLDTVPNHVGPANPWVEDEPTPDWFHGTKAKHLKAETNFNALISPHAPWRDQLGTLDGWFADVLPDMDTDSPVVAQYLRQNAIWWIEETGADGLRIDTFPYVNREFWNAFNGELKRLYPRLTEVGEIFNGDPVITSSFAGGVTRAGADTKLTTPFDFPTYFAVREVFGKGASMKRLADVLANDSLYPHPDALVPFLGNHDTMRFMDAASGRDDHDKEASLELAFAYILTTRGMPQIYSGDEIAMHGGDDPDNRRDFPGGFAGDAKDVFLAEGRSADQQRIFAWVSKLTSLRREYPSLACGGEEVLATGDDWLVYVRSLKDSPAASCSAITPKSGDDGKVLVALHRGTKTPSLDVRLADTWMEGCVLGRPGLGAETTAVEANDGTLHLSGLADGALVVACH